MTQSKTYRAQHEALRAASAKPEAVAAISRYLHSEQARPTGEWCEPWALRNAAALVGLERRRVVVGVDDSAAAFLAVEQAAREASWRGWPLHVVHAHRSRWMTRSGDDVESTTAAELLDRCADRARATVADVPVSTCLRIGPAAGELIDASPDAGLVVVGTRGRGGFSELVTGSVAVHVAEDATAPVLIVRVPPPPVGLEWIQHPIVVGIDGSAASYAALEFAVAEARIRGVDILAVHAALQPPDEHDDPLRHGTLAGFDTHCLGIRVRRRWVFKDPRQALTGLSAQAGATVIGARGRGGFAGLRTGSVAQALIHHAYSPLFVVHDTDSDTRSSPSTAAHDSASHAAGLVAERAGS